MSNERADVWPGGGSFTGRPPRCHAREGDFAAGLRSGRWRFTGPDYCEGGRSWECCRHSPPQQPPLTGSRRWSELLQCSQLVWGWAAQAPFIPSSRGRGICPRRIAPGPSWPATLTKRTSSTSLSSPWNREKPALASGLFHVLSETSIVEATVLVREERGEGNALQAGRFEDDDLGIRGVVENEFAAHAAG